MKILLYFFTIFKVMIMGLFVTLNKQQQLKKKFDGKLCSYFNDYGSDDRSVWFCGKN